MIRHAPRLVASFADPDALRRARHDLAAAGVPDSWVEVQRGDDRREVAHEADPGPHPTRPAEMGSRVPRSVLTTVLAAVAGAGIGALVFRGVDIPHLPRWADLLAFAAMGALPASAYAFIMAGGGGPHPGRETDGAGPQPLTLSVRTDPEDLTVPDLDDLRRTLLAAGARRVVPHVDRPEDGDRGTEAS